MLLRQITAFFFTGGVRTNYLPGGGTVSMDIEQTIEIYIGGEKVDLIQKLNDWFVGDYINFSGTVSGFPTGADPTDYTVKFDLVLDGSIKQTLTSSACDASGNFTVAAALGAAVVAGSYKIYPSLWWSTYSEYEEYFNKQIFARPS